MENCGCFGPNPNDITLKAIPKTFETAKALIIRIDGDVIQLRSRRGVVLERIPLHAVRWLPCSLPGGKDHCMSLQFKEPQPREIFLKAHSRAVVAHHILALDGALAKRPHLRSEIHAVAGPPPAIEEEPLDSPPVDLPEQQEAVSEGPEHTAVRCPRCWQLAQLIDEHEALAQDLEVARADLSACHADLEAAAKEKERLTVRWAAAENAAKTAQQTQRAAEARAGELETCLAEAAERCERLLAELQAAAAAGDGSAARCKELQGALVQAEEERVLLVEALTSTQAQLHDAKKVIKDTAHQLDSASKSCASARTQATSSLSELEEAREEASRHAEASQKVQSELMSLQHALEQAQRDTAENELEWSQERGRLEGALAALQRGRGGFSSSSRDCHGDSLEVAALRAQIDELKQQLAFTREAAAERSQEERILAADAEARKLKEELIDAKRVLEEHHAALKEEVKSLRATAAAAQLEAAEAMSAQNAQRVAAEKTESEAAVLRERLTAALAAQTAAVKERNSLEAGLDLARVNLERLRRKHEALELKEKKSSN